MSTGSLKARLRAALDPVVAAAGYDLEDVEVTPAGNRRLVRVLVDRDGGVSLDDVAELSRLVSATLDDADAMGAAPYLLEVGSPGVDRPLTEIRHWRRARGRLVTASLQGGGRIAARVTGVDETPGAETVSFVPADGGPDAPATVHPLSALGRGAVQVEFGRSEPAAEEVRA